MKTTRKIYCTSYCNFGHYEDTGRPVGHECYVIPPEAIRAEKEDRNSDAIALLQSMRRVLVKGRAAPKGS